MFDVSDLVAEQMAGRTVRMDFLNLFDFVSGPRRVWRDRYPLTSGGHTWDGVGPAFVSVDPGAPSKDGAAEPFSIGLSGVDPSFLTRVRAAESDAVGRTIAIYMQFFAENWQPLGVPLQLRRGKIAGFSFSGAGQQARGIVCRAEGSLVARGRPVNRYISSAQQRADFPDDAGVDYTASMQEQTVIWPK